MQYRIALFLSLLFFLFSPGLHGQDSKQFTTNYIMGGGEAKLLEDAEWFYGIGNHLRALPLFLKLNLHYPGTNAYKYYAGICYLEKTDEQEKAIGFLEAAYSKDPKLPDILFYLGQSYMYSYRFDEAIGYFKLAKDKKRTSSDNMKRIDRLIEQCNNAKDLRSRTTGQVLKLENIGPPINTEFDEYGPLISADESVLIYTYKGKRSQGGLINIYGEPDPDGAYYEDIFGSDRLGDKWLDPESLGSRINSNYHDASIALSADGLSLLVYKDDHGGDIYVSRKIKNTWIQPEPIPGEINTKHYEGHASLSVDERVLFFVSDRPGGYGGQDIYMATLKEDETWGNIVNLGPEINTAYDEDAPFIHANGELLYFSSKGHNSMGGYDIFYATRDGNKWTPAENIGTPVNTPNDDDFYVVSANGERAYFSSARAGGYGGQDIYVVKPGVFGKKPVLALIKGIISNNGRSAQAEIRVTNTTTNEACSIYQSNAASGKYLIALPPGYDYKLDFVLKGDLLHSEDVDVGNLNTYVEVDQDFELSGKKNPFIDSTNILQSRLKEKLAEIEAVKEEIVMEQVLPDSAQEMEPKPVAKLYLLDESGAVLMSSVKDEKGAFNFRSQLLKDDYSMMLDSKDSPVEEEIIVMVKDEQGFEKLITATVVTATAEQARELENSRILITPEMRQRMAEKARMRAEEAARIRTEEEARIRAEEEAKLRAAEEAMAREVEAARSRAIADSISRAEEAERLQAAEAAREYAAREARELAAEKARAEAEKAAEAARLKAAAQAEAKARAEAEAEAKARAEAEAEAKARAEAAARTEAEQIALLDKEAAEREITDSLTVDKPVSGEETARVSEFRNILFDFDKADLRSKSKKELDKVQAALAKDQDLSIAISGHADAIGTEEYNMKLSERRAQRAAAYLIDRGIGESQLRIYAFGKSKPIAANTNRDGSDNPAGRQKNRRVEFSDPASEPDLSNGALLAFSGSTANETGPIPGSPSMTSFFYKVQVAAYRRPENYKHEHLDELGAVDALDVDGVTRFTLGRFENIKEARRFKKLIVKQGTKDAFITAEVDGQRRYLNELGSGPAVAGRTTQKPASPAALAAYKRVMDKFGDENVEGLEFKVQVAAYRHAENYSGKELNALGDIQSLKLPDSITRFTIGSFNTLREAEAFKNKVQEKGGSDAFVTAVYQGNRVLVKDLIANNFYML